ncbi:hypothetical protein [Marispirochaeta sp.]|uniref:hypothetical protein n=1 Tax=Marispirochaeta sp. TaxID=2038653 RepID=UPI0029C81AA4|nr:hypothetical protein [Marispirochaeta sp.]
MASTIIFGLFFSTVTALVVIPLIYGVLYDRPSSGRRFKERSIVRETAEKGVEKER